MSIVACVALASALAVPISALEPPKGKAMRIYIGTYTGPKSQGIYQMRFDPDTGELHSEGLAAVSVNPSFLAMDPRGRYLYAVNEIGSFQGEPTGAVTAFAVEAGGALGELGQQPSHGTGPCHVSVDPRGRVVLVANYGSGSVAAYPVKPDGSLAPASAAIQHVGSGPNRARQEGPHAHCIVPDPTGKRVLAADLGLDQVCIYRLDLATGKLASNDPDHFSVAPGSGPRHIAWAPDGRHAYVINELRSTITVCGYDPATGALRELQTVSSLPEGFHGRSATAEIAAHPSGRFVYGSNRGHDSIAVFSVEHGSGSLKLVGIQPCGGKNPRSFALDPTGRFLLVANQDTDNVVVFRIDQKTGALVATGHTAAVGAPVCVLFAPAAK